MLRIAHRKEAKLLAAFAAGGLVLTPAFAASTAKKRQAPVAVSKASLSTTCIINGGGYSRVDEGLFSHITNPFPRVCLQAGLISSAAQEWVSELCRLRGEANLVDG